jgi:hypothetical protein
MLGRWEWIIIELVVLGFLVAELISVRRSLRKDKQGQHPPPADPLL